MAERPIRRAAMADAGIFVFFRCSAVVLCSVG